MSQISYDLADSPEHVEDLARAISKIREPLCEIAATSPAPVAFFGGLREGL